MVAMRKELASFLQAARIRLILIGGPYLE